MGLAPERVSGAALVSPAGIAAGPFLRILVEIGAPTLLYRLRPTEERLTRAAMPLFTEPEAPAFGPAVRQLGAALRHLRLDADLPRRATEEELAGFGGQVAVFASEGDALFPAGLSSRGQKRSSPTSPWPSSSKAAATSPRRRRSVG
jgi:hypothetical protein